MQIWCGPIGCHGRHGVPWATWLQHGGPDPCGVRGPDRGSCGAVEWHMARGNWTGTCRFKQRWDLICSCRWVHMSTRAVCIFVAHWPTCSQALSIFLSVRSLSVTQIIEWNSVCLFLCCLFNSYRLFFHLFVLTKFGRDITTNGLLDM